MKHRFLKTLLFTFLLFPVTTFANENWIINSYDTKMEIQNDSSINITEKIEFDFGNTKGHGIYRKIPYKYQARGGLFSYKYSEIKVKDEYGKDYVFTTENDWSNLNIKVGEENKLIDGTHVYIISYKIKRAINYFNDHDELYWNIVGTEWDNPITKASADIIFPRPIEEEDAKFECYQGQTGSRESCFLNPQYIISDSKIVGYRYETRDLSPGYAMTIVASMPKGTVYEPTDWEKALEILKDNWIIILPFITLFFMYRVWNKYGRDPKGRGVIVAQFDSPDNLSPSEVGAIIDSNVSNKDISSEIIQLAILGYIKINRIVEKKFLGENTDYSFEKLKEPDEKLNVIQKKLMMAMFTKREKESFGKVISGLKVMIEKKETFTEKGLINFGPPRDIIQSEYNEKGGVEIIKLSDLKNSFYTDINALVKETYSSVLSKGYFPKNPTIVRVWWVLSGVIVIGAGFLGGIIGPIWLFSIVISGLIIVIFGFFMSRVSKKGAIAKEHILGLKQYLKVAEADRIKFHNAPDKNPKLFEKLLPFAMVLGVEKEWAKQFEGIYNQSPSWYYDSSGATFNSIIFASSMRSFSDIATQSLSSSPGGGSGFGGGAGGGGGGGGGGGW